MIYPALLLSTLLFASLTRAAEIAQRQVQSSAYTTRTLDPLQPSGIQPGQGSLESTFPYICSLGCQVTTGTYFYCFVLDTYPFNGGPVNRTLCDTSICNQGYYDALSACLNCIIANGNERPFGYSTNTSLTAEPTNTAGGGLDLPINPNELIGVEQANAILGNVTRKCEGLSSGAVSLTGETTVTASATTTGPYETSWTSGQTVAIPEWTGLTRYTSGLDVFTSARVTTVYLSATQAASAGSSVASGTTGAGAGTGSGSASAGAGSASASATGSAGRIAMISSLAMGGIAAGVLVVTLI